MDRQVKRMMRAQCGADPRLLFFWMQWILWRFTIAIKVEKNGRLCFFLLFRSHRFFDYTARCNIHTFRSI